MKKIEKKILTLCVASIPLTGIAATTDCQKMLASNVQPRQEMLLNLNNLKNKAKMNPSIMSSQTFSNSINMAEKLAKVESRAKVAQSKMDYMSCLSYGKEESELTSLLIIYISKLNKAASEYNNQITDLIKLGKCPNNSCVGDQGSNLNNQISEINSGFYQQLSQKAPSYLPLIPKSVSVEVGGYKFEHPEQVCRSESEQMDKLKKEKSYLAEKTIDNIMKQNWIQTKMKISGQIRQFESADLNKKPLYKSEANPIEMNSCANKMSFEVEYFKYSIKYLNSLNDGILNVNTNASKIKSDSKCIGVDDCNVALTNYLNRYVSENTKESEASLKIAIDKYSH